MKRTSATRVVTSTLGVLVGLAGVEHGVFEILQGNVAIGGFMIDAIGPAQKLWENVVHPGVNGSMAVSRLTQHAGGPGILKPKLTKR